MICLFYPRGRTVPIWAVRRRSATRSGARDLAVVRGKGPFAANNSEELRGAAAAGLGIALLPDFSAQSGLHSGKLVQVLPDWEPVDSFATTCLQCAPTRRMFRGRSLRSSRFSKASSPMAF